MAHEFDSGMFTAEKAWHGLGTVVSSAPTTEEAIKLAGMDWQVREQPLITYHPGSSPSLVEGWKCLKRSDNDFTLNVCRDSWTPVQNVDAFRFFDPLIQDGDIELDAAVSLADGKRIAITAKVKDGIGEVIKDDPVEQYLVLYNSHDGSLSLGVMFSNIRVVCANTLGFAISDAKRKGRYKKFNGDNIAIHNKMIRLKHTQGIHDNLAMVRDAVNLSRQQFELTMESYRAMAKTDMNVELFRKYLTSVFNSELRQEDGSLKPITEYVHYEQLEKNFNLGKGMDIKGVGGTLWAGFQSVTEFATHQRGHGDDIESARNRLNQMWFGSGAQLINKAKTEALALV